MATFFASCPTGMNDLVETELKELGLKTFEKTNGGVLFESNWAGCYKANLNSRYASRILKPILDFPAYQNEELYNNIRKHDFTKYIKPNQTLAIDAVVKDCMLHDQRFVAMKIKDAIVDQFRDKFGVSRIKHGFTQARIGYRDHEAHCRARRIELAGVARRVAHFA